MTTTTTDARTYGGRVIGAMTGGSVAALIGTFALTLALTFDPALAAKYAAIAFALPFVICALILVGVCLILLLRNELVYALEAWRKQDINQDGSIGRPTAEPQPKHRWLLSRSPVNTSTIAFDDNETGIGNADLQWFITRAFTRGYAVRDYIGQTFPSGEHIRHATHPLVVEGYRVLEEAGLLTGRAEGVKGVLHGTLQDALKATGF
jgi:hypothetical protein